MSKQYICPLCKEPVESGPMAGYVHIQRYHTNITDMLQTRVIPVKSSNRTHDQIVAAWEVKNSRHIVSAGHAETCPCEVCLNVKLDRIIALGEATNDNPSDLVGFSYGD